jgi:sec-independent protein translocase protein TatB
MFDVGFSELLIIAVVALLVLGPERLPKAARFAGLWVRRARAQWYSVKAELERELANEEFKRSLSNPLSELAPQMRELEKGLRDEFAGIDTSGVDLAAKELAASERVLRDAVDEPVIGEPTAIASIDAETTETTAVVGEPSGDDEHKLSSDRS